MNKPLLEKLKKCKKKSAFPAGGAEQPDIIELFTLYKANLSAQAGQIFDLGV